MKLTLYRRGSLAEIPSHHHPPGCSDLSPPGVLNLTPECMPLLHHALSRIITQVQD